MSLEAIAALLGHRSLDMTLRYAKIASRTVADELAQRVAMVLGIVWVGSRTLGHADALSDDDLEVLLTDAEIEGVATAVRTALLRQKRILPSAAGKARSTNACSAPAASWKWSTHSPWGALGGTCQ